MRLRNIQCLRRMLSTSQNFNKIYHFIKVSLSEASNCQMFAILHNLKNKINFREESFKGIVFVLQIVQAW